MANQGEAGSSPEPWSPTPLPPPPTLRFDDLEGDDESLVDWRSDLSNIVLGGDVGEEEEDRPQPLLFRPLTLDKQELGSEQGPDEEIRSGGSGELGDELSIPGANEDEKMSSEGAEDEGAEWSGEEGARHRKEPEEEEEEEEPSVVIASGAEEEDLDLDDKGEDLMLFIDPRLEGEEDLPFHLKSRALTHEEVLASPSFHPHCIRCLAPPHRPSRPDPLLAQASPPLSR